MNDHELQKFSVMMIISFIIMYCVVLTLPSLIIFGVALPVFIWPC